MKTSGSLPHRLQELIDNLPRLEYYVSEYLVGWPEMKPEKSENPPVPSVTVDASFLPYQRH